MPADAVTRGAHPQVDQTQIILEREPIVRGGRDHIEPAAGAEPMRRALEAAHEKTLEHRGRHTVGTLQILYRSRCRPRVTALQRFETISFWRPRFSRASCRHAPSRRTWRRIPCDRRLRLRSRPDVLRPL